MKTKLTRREFASFIANLTLSFLGKQLDPLHYRAMLKFEDKLSNITKVILMQ